ncbi:hypothetical protein A0J48_021045 [Sphaerospermopsis aphanizomenoides BCCUSP55]|nr:hypothetical protein [Sphaerospermopsis aphanizomenoides BCCUSP55]
MGLGAKLLDEVINDPQFKEIENITIFYFPEMIPFYGQWKFKQAITSD